MDFSGLAFQGVTWVISLLSAIISQDAVAAPKSIALMSEFISCCSVPQAPEDPPFCKIPGEDRSVSIICKCGFLVYDILFHRKQSDQKP